MYYDITHLLTGIYPSYDGSRILRVRGYMEMLSTCNLVNVQMMHGIYINNRHPDAHHEVYDILHLHYAKVHTALAPMISVGRCHI